MTPEQILDRVGKLMRLALNNPNEQEALRAALACLKLMDAHKMVVTLPVSTRPPAPPTFRPGPSPYYKPWTGQPPPGEPPYEPPVNPFEMDIEEFLRRAKTRQAAEARQEAEQQRVEAEQQRRRWPWTRTGGL